MSCCLIGQYNFTIKLMIGQSETNERSHDMILYT